MDNTQIERKKAKKDRFGRWSTAQSNLFEELIERYGKNWKKIHQHMRGRSLSQIRSHAQKFFDKIGPKKTQEFERRAKVLEALETLEKEKRMAETENQSQIHQETLKETAIKQEEEEPLQPTPVIQENGGTSLPPHVISPNNQENVKVEEPNFSNKTAKTNLYNLIYPLPAVQNQNGFLMHLIYLNPDAFSRYELGLEQFYSNQIQNNSFRYPGESK